MKKLRRIGMGRTFGIIGAVGANSIRPAESDGRMLFAPTFLDLAGQMLFAPTLFAFDFVHSM